jgi:hypothetical protein
MKLIAFLPTVLFAYAHAWVNNENHPVTTSFCTTGSSVADNTGACVGGTEYAVTGVTYNSVTECVDACRDYHSGGETNLLDKYLLGCTCDSGGGSTYSLTIHYGSANTEYISAIAADANKECHACQACLTTECNNAGECVGGYCQCDYPNSGWRCDDTTDCTCA